jgi:hypothetical protein
MAIAMAGMLAPGLTTVPDTGWEVIFGLLTAWFAGRVARDARANGVRALASGHCVPHLVHSAAMLYMFLAIAASAVSGGPGMGETRGPAMRILEYPALAFVFVLVLVGCSIWDLDQLSGSRCSLASTRAVLASVTAAGVPGMPPEESATFAGLRATGNSAAAHQAVPCGGEPGGGSAVPGLAPSPAVTVGCRIVMGITMALMLLIMI